MKKILFFFVLSVMSFLIMGFNVETYSKDIMPVRSELNQTRTIGLYQIGDDVQIYKEPSEESQILYRIRWDNDEFFPTEIGAENFFVVFLPNKSLELVAVTDMTEDWIEIVYDKTSGKTGWIKMDDPYKFMTWINFYNTYGKKYGLKILGGAPNSCKDIKASTEDLAKTISTINHPTKIKLNVIRGNWALVSVMDMDKTPKTGYVRWRSDDGVRYFFPAIK